MLDIKFLGKQSSIIWYAADFAIKLGVTRLIAFPLIAHKLSPESFGTFITAMSVALVLGGALTAAFGNFIIKTLGGELERSRTNASYFLSITAMLWTAGLFVAAASLLRALHAPFASGDFWLWLLVFALHYTMSVQTETLLATLRVSRKFKSIAGIHLIGVLAMLTALILPGFSAKTAVALSILTWSALPMGVTLFLFKDTLQAKKKQKLGYQRVSQIFHFFVGGIATFLTEYIDRILLAIWWPAEIVSTFFAAASLAMLMSAPGLIISTYLFSMLSKIPFSKISDPRYFLIYFIFVIGICCAVYLTGLLLGDYLLQLLYPNQHKEAALIYKTCLLSAAILSCSTLLKPVVTRYHLSAITPMISLTTLVIRFLIAYYLIKSGGIIGAANALVYGAAITSLIWMAPYFSLMGGRAFHPDTNGK